MNGYGIETYADLAKTVGGMVLANEMAHRPLELVSGDFTHGTRYSSGTSSATPTS